MRYHHGNLREGLLDAAAEVIAARGPSGLNLRELARQLGVSHTAPRHHFGDKRGLVTALAAQGYRLLAATLRSAEGDFLEAGVSYVRFAVAHPGHFAVMFKPKLVNDQDPALLEARLETRAALLAGAAAQAVAVGRDPSPPGSGTLPPYALLAWGAAHGLADLALTGILGPVAHAESPEEIEALARAALSQLDPPDR